MKRKNTPFFNTPRQPVPKKPFGTQFKDFYEENINWMNQIPKEDVLQTLKGFYSEYFSDEGTNYTKMRNDICMTSKRTDKCEDLFRCLFKMPFITSMLVTTPDLIQIEEEFGPLLIAHGIEEAKGGMYNILLMCVSNQVRVTACSWGPFVESLPNISPLGHGPYYLVYQLPGLTDCPEVSDNVPLSSVARILVPFEENRDILIQTLDKMATVGLVDLERKAACVDKIKTYAEFLNELRNLNELKVLKI